MSSMMMMNNNLRRRAVQMILSQKPGNNRSNQFLAYRSLSTTLSTTATKSKEVSIYIHNLTDEPKVSLGTSNQMRNLSTEAQTQLKEEGDGGGNDNSNGESQNKTEERNDPPSKNMDPLRLLPTRHSSKCAPSIAPVDILDSATDKILNSTTGTLFAYDHEFVELSKETEYQKGLDISHYYQEHVEYLLRGYSSLLPSSLVHLQESTLPANPNTKERSTIAMNNQLTYENNNSSEKGEEIVNKMIQLIARMEEEGNAYVELRSKLRSQLMAVNQQLDPSNDKEEEQKQDQVDDHNNDDDESDNEFAESSRQNWQLTQLIHHYGAPPGPSTAMYDLTLDAIANIINDTSNPVSYLRKARALHQSALERNDLDREQKMDVVNVNSVPTAATFNAMIRTSSLVEERDGYEELRDVAVENAFLGYDAIFHHNVVERNSATYKYMVKTVNKFFPDCEAKGYILVALWEKCTLQERLLDEDIIRAFLEVNSEDCGEKFHPWMISEIKDVFDEKENGYGFPLKFSKNKKLRRYDRRLDVY